jgi:hypothetical protein
MTLSVGMIAKMSLELMLGICIKLFCDNGRIHWRDFVNDFLFWLPGVDQEAGDGLTRQLAAAPEADEADHLPTALAAK